MKGVIDRKTSGIDGMSGSCQKIRIMPVCPVLRLIDREVKNRLPDTGPFRSQTFAEKSSGSQYHSPGMDPDLIQSFPDKKQKPSGIQCYHLIHLMLKISLNA
jgi:hypothetical protein